MSAKWQRIKRWDQDHLTGVLAPVRIVLFWLSSIRLAVILLTFVALYAVLASVPIGLLAMIPTLLIRALIFCAVAAVIAVPTVWAARKLTATRGRALRFSATLLTGAAALGLALAVELLVTSPALAYDSATGSGLRLFPEFVSRHDSTTMRRLPGIEMTELEFYSWWPLRYALLLFCLNLIVATIRRIEFSVKTLGVLSVHAGIITIALGSIFYTAYKQEGDTILFAAASAPGMPATDAPGPPQRSFYDNTAVVLYVAQYEGLGGSSAWEQRSIPRLPRYNDYNLTAALPAGADPLTPPPIDPAAPGLARTLAIDLPEGESQFVDPDIRVRVVGYASYATLWSDWARAPAPATGDANPLREIELYADIPQDSTGARVDPDRPVFRFALMPRAPRTRVSANAVMSLEYTLGLDDARWDHLATALPARTPHALVVSLPSLPEPAVIPAIPGRRVEIPGTGFALTVEQLHDEPPFPIITPGYENASSPVAVVRVETPATEDSPPDTFERWIYERFPALDQDIRGTQADGRPARAPADTSVISLSYINAARLAVHIDERPDGTARALVRDPGGALRVVDPVPGDRLDNIVDGIDLVIAERWAHAAPVEAPAPVPDADRQGDLVGTHEHAYVATEITSDAIPGWSRTVWVPFSRYLGSDSARTQRDVQLPDGRSVKIAFGRRQRPLPGFQVRMVDFEMIAYDHRGAPRDYQSTVRVEPARSLADVDPIDPYDHVVKLNAPLRAPFHWDDAKPWITNALRRVRAGLDPAQFKLSQAGWDRQGWMDTTRLADEGLIDRPRAQFTILGVGNNPGIHVIAFGAILFSVGIPYAFYVKPLLLRREKRRLQQLHAPRAQDAPEPAPTPAEHAPKEEVAV